MVFEINNLGSIARRAPAAAWELGHSTAQCCAGGCGKKGVMSFMWGTALALTSAFLQDVSCMEWSVLAASEQGKPTAIPCCAVLCCAVQCCAAEQRSSTEARAWFILSLQHCKELCMEEACAHFPPTAPGKIWWSPEHQNHLSNCVRAAATLHVL